MSRLLTWLMREGLWPRCRGREAFGDTMHLDTHKWAYHNCDKPRGHKGPHICWCRRRIVVRGDPR